LLGFPLRILPLVVYWATEGYRLKSSKFCSLAAGNERTVSFLVAA
jgi:hypothetical protein